MQAVVKTPHINITVEGEYIPPKVINFLKKEFGTNLKVSNKVNKNDDSLEIKNTQWYRDIKSQITPGDNLKIYRNNKGYSQGKLAELIGVLPSNISEMERGKRGISKDMAKKFSRLLEVGVEKFI